MKNADGVVQNQVDEEALIANSKAVASATAQLVVASRVRSDPNSPKLKK